MKKILSIFLLVFAFSLTASAQTDRTTLESEIKTKAKKDLHDLSQVVDLSNPELFQSLHRLFLNKHEQLSGVGVSEEEKKQILDGVRDKLIGTLSGEQIALLNEKGMLDKLTK